MQEGETIIATPQFPDIPELRQCSTRTDTIQEQTKAGIISLLNEMRASGPLGAATVDSMLETVLLASQAGLSPRNRHGRKIIRKLGERLFMEHLLAARQDASSGIKQEPTLEG